MMRMETSLRIAKTYRKCRLAEQGSDFLYWQTESYQERMDALEQIRQDYHRWRYGAEPRLQRVYTIAKR